MSALSDAELAERLAVEAGDMLLHLSRSGKLAGSELGRAGDKRANRMIVDTLRSERPQDAILSEEEADDLARLDARRVWIIDPLDGTREYSEGREDWAVHVALAINGHPAVGAVAVPARRLVLASSSPPAVAEANHPPRIILSRTRPPAVAEALASALGAESISMGSVGAKSAALMLGEADIYLHAGDQREWDSCAPAAVALAAGYVATRLDGAALRYNQPVPIVPDLLICHPACEAGVREALGA